MADNINYYNIYRTLAFADVIIIELQIMALPFLNNFNWPIILCTKNITKTLLQSVRNRWWSNIKTNYKVVLPGNVTEQLSPHTFSHKIVLPPYALNGIPPPIGRWKGVNILLELCGVK